jgi:hypothetical protein
VQVHYDEGVGAARLAAILAGESPVSRGVQSLLQSYPATGLSVESLEVKAPVGREGGQIRLGGEQLGRP